MSQAVATSSAFADRLCIATQGSVNQMLSTEELAFCCHLCGFGCHGGYPIRAWSYFRRHGIVTGGDYESYEVNNKTFIFMVYLAINRDLEKKLRQFSDLFKGSHDMSVLSTVANLLLNYLINMCKSCACVLERI